MVTLDSPVSSVVGVIFQDDSSLVPTLHLLLNDEHYGASTCLNMRSSGGWTCVISSAGPCDITNSLHM